MKARIFFSLLFAFSFLTTTAVYSNELNNSSKELKNCKLIFDTSYSPRYKNTKRELIGIRNARITMLRVHKVGTKYGPPNDQIDVEVVIQLANRDGAYGFKLRNDNNEPANQGMLNLLRDAFNNDWLVNIDYEIQSPNDVRPRKKNGVIIRVWLTKPRQNLVKKATF